MVIGLIDEHGSKVFAAGKLDNGTEAEVGADSLFEIGSITKVFTALLLRDMVDRSQMQLKDAVKQFLPLSVKVPTHGEKKITLLHLATHSSGLPPDPKLWKSSENIYANYSAEALYGFLSDYALQCDPGAEVEYSNVGMALLGQAIALKADKDYESLAIERICSPLGLASARITLTPELRKRLAIGHNKSGEPVADWTFNVYGAAAGLHSTANDLLKFLSMNIGLAESELTPTIDRAQQIYRSEVPRFGNLALGWMDRDQSDQIGSKIWVHAGGTGGCDTFIGFDKTHRRGVVVLSNQVGIMQSEPIGLLLLEQVELTPTIAKAFSSNDDLAGIGLTLAFDRKNRVIYSQNIAANSPAARAKLSQGLVLKSIDGVPAANKSLLECGCLIQGVPGTAVRLEFADPAGQINTVDLVRER